MSKPESREELRKKLRASIEEKKLLRSSNQIKNKVVDDNLKKKGITDVEKFKKDLKKMDLEKMLEKLKSNGIDINSLLEKNLDK
jgi:hypothetical protein